LRRKQSSTGVEGKAWQGRSPRTATARTVRTLMGLRGLRADREEVCK